ALGGPRAQLLLLLGGQSGPAVGADDEVVGARALLRPLDHLGQVDLAVQLGVGPEVRADHGDDQHSDDGDGRPLDAPAPVRGGALRVAAVTSRAARTARPGGPPVDLAGVVAAAVAVVVAVVVAAVTVAVDVGRLGRHGAVTAVCRRGRRAPADLPHHAGAFGLCARAAAAVAAAAVVVGPC